MLDLSLINYTMIPLVHQSTNASQTLVNATTTNLDSIIIFPSKASVRIQYSITQQVYMN